MPLINITQSVAKVGAELALKETWGKQFPTFEKQIKLLANFVPKNNKRTAPYVFKDAVPFPEFWPYGQGRTYKTYKDRYIDVGIYNYSLAISYSGFDEEDDQLGDLRAHTNLAVQRYFQLPDKLFAEYFNGVPNLNPALKLAYDGVGLFAAVDGDGANRFAAAGGNIVVGSGAGTVAAFVRDLSAAQQRFLNFRDLAGQVLFSPEDAAFTKMHVIVPNSFNEIVQKATNSEFMRTDNTSLVADSNWLKGSFQYHLNPYLTDQNDWYVVMKNDYYKPFVYRAPSSVEAIWADMNNSDASRDKNERTLFTHIRVGVAPWFPACIIKINN